VKLGSVRVFGVLRERRDAVVLDAAEKFQKKKKKDKNGERTLIFSNSNMLASHPG
jgi:hypothetical protein